LITFVAAHESGEFDDATITVHEAHDEDAFEALKDNEEEGIGQVGRNGGPTEEDRAHGADDIAQPARQGQAEIDNDLIAK